MFSLLKIKLVVKRSSLLPNRDCSGTPRQWTSDLPKLTSLFVRLYIRIPKSKKYEINKCADNNRITNVLYLISKIIQFT